MHCGGTGRYIFVKCFWQPDSETSHIEFEVYFPPYLILENAKNSLDVEGPHHYNIFFWESGKY